MSEIITNNGTYKYKPVKLYYGRKIIDLEVSKYNLLDFKELLDSNGIPFGIIYGTLLGAVREQNFIDYDEDIDVFILDEYREELLSLLFKFRLLGFEVARYNKDLLSIIKSNDYIDIYFFKKNIIGYRVCNADAIRSKYIDSFDTIEFLGVEFNVPMNYIDFLEKAYGRDWMIPHKNMPADVKGVKTKIKSAIIYYMPVVFVNYLKCISKMFRKNKVL